MTPSLKKSLNKQLLQQNRDEMGMRRRMLYTLIHCSARTDDDIEYYARYILSKLNDANADLIKLMRRIVVERYGRDVVSDSDVLRAVVSILCDVHDKKRETFDVTAAYDEKNGDGTTDDDCDVFKKECTDMDPLMDAKKCFKTLALKYHPDRRNGQTAAFQSLNNCHETKWQNQW